MNEIEEKEIELYPALDSMANTYTTLSESDNIDTCQGYQNKEMGLLCAVKHSFKTSQQAHQYEVL